MESGLVRISSWEGHSIHLSDESYWQRLRPNLFNLSHTAINKATTNRTPRSKMRPTCGLNLNHATQSPGLNHINKTPKPSWPSLESQVKVDVPKGSLLTSPLQSRHQSSWLSKGTWQWGWARQPSRGVNRCFAWKTWKLRLFPAVFNRFLSKVKGEWW